MTKRRQNILVVGGIIFFGDYPGLDFRKSRFSRWARQALIFCIQMPTRPARASSLMPVRGPVSEFLGAIKSIDVFNFTPNEDFGDRGSNFLKLLGRDLYGRYHVVIPSWAEHRFCNDWWRYIIGPWWGPRWPNGHFDPTSHAVGWRLTKTFNDDIGKNRRTLVANTYLTGLYENISTQLPFGSFFGAAHQVARGNPQKDSGEGKNGRECRNDCFGVVVGEVPQTIAIDTEHARDRGNTLLKIRGCGMLLMLLYAGLKWLGTLNDPSNRK
jgi:hypothetical protein